MGCSLRRKLGFPWLRGDKQESEPCSKALGSPSFLPAREREPACLTPGYVITALVFLCANPACFFLALCRGHVAGGMGAAPLLFTL